MKFIPMVSKMNQLIFYAVFEYFFSHRLIMNQTNQQLWQHPHLRKWLVYYLSSRWIRLNHKKIFVSDILYFFLFFHKMLWELHPRVIIQLRKIVSNTSFFLLTSTGIRVIHACFIRTIIFDTYIHRRSSFRSDSMHIIFVRHLFVILEVEG
jgi:hypothetical protein